VLGLFVKYLFTTGVVLFFYFVPCCRVGGAHCVCYANTNGLRRTIKEIEMNKTETDMNSEQLWMTDHVDHWTGGRQAPWAAGGDGQSAMLVAIGAA
jgi:hypothetical protein